MSSNRSPERVTSLLRRAVGPRVSPGGLWSLVLSRLRGDQNFAARQSEGFPLLVQHRRPHSFDSRHVEVKGDDAGMAGTSITPTTTRANTLSPGRCRHSLNEDGDMWRERRVKERYAEAAKRAAKKLRERQSTATWGLYAQYFGVGCIYGGLPSTLYGFFLTYLNVPGYVYASASTAIALPWSLKFIFGAINDCCPINGYRRKPYMVLGWCICALALGLLAATPLPDPYWCVGYDASLGRLAYTKTDSAKPCNVSAADSAGKFTLLMTLASFGYCVSDVAADGLTVTLARAEPSATRGQTQTTVYLYRTLGNIAAVVLVGACMNSWRFGGTFEWGLSFSQVSIVFAVIAVAMVPISYSFVNEPKPQDEARDNLIIRPQNTTMPVQALPRRNLEDAIKATPRLSARIRRPVTFREYAQSVWTLLRSRAMFYCVLYQFLSPAIGGIFTTAGPEVKQHWASVRVLQNAGFSLIGLVLFTLGLWLVKAYLLDHSWRAIILVTTIFLNILDMPFSLLTVFDVVRSQYFFLGETVLAEIPTAVRFIVSTFVIVEMAEGGDEGIVYGLLTTVGNLGSPVAQAVSNQLFGLLKPALSDPQNYVEDKTSFRFVVAWSYIVTYSASFLSLVTLPLLPNQKNDARRRKIKWGSNDAFAIWTIALVILGLFYACLVNVLVVFPETSCLRLVGGAGCRHNAEGIDIRPTSSP